MARIQLSAAEGAVQIEQDEQGDRNQTIGQVVGGMVVYVSGGQAIINASDKAEEDSASTRAELGANPYMGLLAFHEKDGDRFFGRDTQIEQLWQQFRELHESEVIRLLPIYGPSGSGKSSLARAGLIPELARQPLPGQAKARVAVLVPGTHPLEALGMVLARVATNDPSPVAKSREFCAELAQMNAAGEYDGLRRIADSLPDVASSPLIVLVDQLEEIFTLCEGKAERTAFVQNLLCAGGDRAKRVSVIVTLRSDFLGETQQEPQLNRLFSEQGFLAPAMNEAELRETISKPAALAGHPLDEGTVGRLIDQTTDREGALPLLQFALSRIWQGMAAGVTPAKTLDEIGGVGGALAGEAERVYQGLSAEQQKIARRLFLGLVRLGEGTRDTRRRVVVSNLVSQSDDLSTVKQGLEKFTDVSVRLVTCSATEEGIETAEVTHEALFDHWARFQRWLEESRSDLRFQRRLEEAAMDWDEMGRPEGKLWRSPDLDVLRQYAERAGDEMTPLEMTFFTASRQAIEKAKKERQRQRRLLVGGLSVGLLLTSGAAVFATYQMQRFERQRVDQLATTSEALLLSGQPVDAKIYALAATGASQSAFVKILHPAPFQSAYASLLESVQANAEQTLIEHKGFRSVVFSPDGKQIVSGEIDGTVRRWDAVTGEAIGEPLRGHAGGVFSIAFSPDGKQIVSGERRNGTIRRWDAVTGEAIGKPLRGHKGGVLSIAFSPDSQQIVTGGEDGTIRSWNAVTGEAIGKPLKGHEDLIYSVSFSPDGQQIISLGDDRTIRRWDVATGKAIGEPLRGYERGVFSVASPDGKQIISGRMDGTIRRLDAVTGEAIGEPLRGYEDGVFSGAFSPDSKQIISGGEDGTIRLWDAATGEAIGEPLRGHEYWVTSVAFSPDGKQIVSMGDDGTIRLWDAATGEAISKLLNHGSAVNSVAFSPDGKQIASGGIDDMVRQWDAATGEVIGEPLSGHEDRVNSVAFSPDSKQIISGGEDGTIRRWDAATGEAIGEPLSGHENGVSSVAFSPDGQQIISGGWDEKIRRWDAVTGEAIGNPLSGHEDGVSSVTFSPDGQQIVSGGWDETIWRWDAVTGKAIGEPLRGHESAVYSAAFSPDSQQIVSGGLEGTVRQWDAVTGEAISKPLRDHWGGVSSVAFSPDGQQIISGGADGIIRLWQISQEKLLQVTCNQLRQHPVLTAPETGVEKEAKRTCDRYVFGKEKTSS